MLLLPLNDSWYSNPCFRPLDDYKHSAYKLRDTGQIVNVSTRVGFYFTPVFYTIDMIADSRIPAEYFSAIPYRQSNGCLSVNIKNSNHGDSIGN